MTVEAIAQAARQFKKPRKPGVHYVSASQLKNWLACRRMWGFEKIDRRERPTTKKQGFGHDGHAVLEAWLKFGTEPPDTAAGRAVKQVIKKGWLPPPMVAGVLAEEELDGALPGWPIGVEPTGFVDAIDARDLELPVVIDLKTTSDLQWAMSAEELAADPQAILYAAWLAREMGSRFVKVRWLYSAMSWPRDGGPPKPKGARMVEHTFDTASPEWQKAYGEIVAAALDIAHARRDVKQAIDLPANGKACGAYNGCFFLAVCPVTDLELVGGMVDRYFESESRMQSTQNQKKDPMSESLLDKVKRNRPAAPAADTTPTPAAATEAKPAAPTPAAVAPSKPVQASLLDKVATTGATKGVNPPEQKPAEPKPDAAPAAAVAAASSSTSALLDKVRKAKAEGTTPAPAAQAAPATSEAAPAQPSVAPASAQAAPAAPQAASEVAPTETPKPAKEKKPKGGDAAPGPFASPGLAVFFDCIFEKRITADMAGVYYLADLLKPIEEAVAKANNVEHWGLIDFAKGNAQLARVFEKWLDEANLGGVIYVDTCTKSACAVKDVLRRKASIVVQGNR